MEGKSKRSRRYGGSTHRRRGAQPGRSRFIKGASGLAFLVLLLWHTSMQAGSSFRNVLTPSSLSQSSVLAMVQDSLGFLWIGTKDGLNRFDGYEYVSYFLPYEW